MGSCVVCKLCKPERLIKYFDVGTSKEELMHSLGTYWAMHAEKEHPDHPIIVAMHKFAKENIKYLPDAADVRTGTPDDYKSEITYEKLSAPPSASNDLEVDSDA